jgi:hypothetical protein
MKVKRNELCPCGSGKKYKHCHEGTPDPMVDELLPPITWPPIPAFPGAQAQSGVRVLRSCDGCTACCTDLTINDPELVLPTTEPCPNLGNRGCSIYGESMPQTCRNYLCTYLVEPGPITPDERPDRVGAIVRVSVDRTLEPPMDRATFVNECLPGGLRNVLRNRIWGYFIRHDLAAGIPTFFSVTNDPLNREVIPVRFLDGKLRCELTSCHQDGKPVLKTMQPVYEPPIELALVIPNQGFPFDADLLVRQLGDRPLMVISPSEATPRVNDLHFLFTQRQAQLLRMLLVCARTPVPERPPPICFPDLPSGSGVSMPVAASA